MIILRVNVLVSPAHSERIQINSVETHGKMNAMVKPGTCVVQSCWPMKSLSVSVIKVWSQILFSFIRRLMSLK